MSDSFEHLRPSMNRESVLMHASCTNLTAVGTEDPYVLRVVQSEADQTGFAAPGEKERVPILAKILDVSSTAVQKIPTRQCGIIPMDQAGKFSIQLGEYGSRDGLHLDVDVSNMTVDHVGEKTSIEKNRPILIGRNTECIWKDGAPKGIGFSELSSKFGISSRHAALAVISVDGRPCLFIEDLSKYGTSVKFEAQTQKQKKPGISPNMFISDPNIFIPAEPNMFISDPNISLPDIQKVLGRMSSLLESDPSMFQSNPGMIIPEPEKLGSHVHIAAATQESPFHAQNEDSYKINLKTNTAMLADGMGGHKLGRVASETAVTRADEIMKTIKESDTPEEVKKILIQAVNEADLAVREKTQGGGTTLDIARILKNDGKRTLVYAHTGDSRIVIKRGEDLVPVTQDQSTLWRDYKMKIIDETQYKRISRVLDIIDDPSKLDADSLRYFKTRHVVGACLGMGSLDVEADIIELQEGDQVILFSDGVTDSLTELRIGLGLNRSKIPSEQAQTLVADVVTFAFQEKNMFIPNINEKVRGKPDDITVIVME